MEEFPKRFPKEKERDIYSLWQKSGAFNPDKLPLTLAKKEPFVIAIPPPNITGSLHMGHALNATCQDIIVRFKRMQGYKTLWIPGIDHAGIATQNVVEKTLIKNEGKTRHDLGKEKILEKIWQWKEKYGNIILDQLKIIGASCDWSRIRFTMDKDYQEAVKNAFLRYQKEGLIYQGERIINWCSHCGTALSDIELEYREEKSFLWYIKYPFKNDPQEFITVATTRPETMLGDTAVAVNPKDKRFKKLIGKTAVLPLVNREIPIIADEAVDQKFGTGAVKVTPAHDPIDFEIGQRHKLAAIKVIDEKIKIIRQLADQKPASPQGRYAGLKINEARKKIEEDLKKEKYLLKKIPYTHQIPHCYRCHSVVEPLLSKQWFLKMKPLAKKAMEAVEKGKVQFKPERYKKVYLEWMENVKDWCISRQIWWGHKIPIAGEDDVLDTWFSSALWPFAVLGWTGDKQKDTESKDLKKFYPTTDLFTAKDIIFLWVARMIFSSLFFTNQIPFKNVYIHSTILNPEGKRMSKSLGTGVDPLDLWQKYGADGVRFGLAAKAGFRQEIRFKEEDYIAGRNFSTKIWNATRFIYLNLPASPVGGDEKTDLPSLEELQKQNLTESQKKTLKYLSETIEEVANNIEKFRFDLAQKSAYEFFWHHFCDKTIEEEKNALKNKDKITQKFLLFVLIASLKMLHPFAPFVTEASFQELSKKINLGKTLLITQPWPKI